MAKSNYKVARDGANLEISFPGNGGGRHYFKYKLKVGDIVLFDDSNRCSDYQEYYFVKLPIQELDFFQLIRDCPDRWEGTASPATPKVSLANDCVVKGSISNPEKYLKEIK